MLSNRPPKMDMLRIRFIVAGNVIWFIWELSWVSPDPSYFLKSAEAAAPSAADS